MDDRRGIANMADAAMFLVIMTTVGAMLFVAPLSQHEGPDAEAAHDILVSTEIRIDRLSERGYGSLPLHELLLLAHERGGEAWNRTVDIAEGLLAELTPDGHLASWSLGCAGDEVAIGDGNPGDSVSVRSVPSSVLGEEAVLTLMISMA